MKFEGINTNAIKVNDIYECLGEYGKSCFYEVTAIDESSVTLKQIIGANKGEEVICDKEIDDKYCGFCIAYVHPTGWHTLYRFNEWWTNEIAKDRQEQSESEQAA